MKHPCSTLFRNLAVLFFAACSAVRGQVRITEVNVSARNVEVTNFGSAEVNLSNWFFCHQFIYPNLGGTIAAGASRQFTVQFNQTASDLCLYNAPDFGSTTAMEDFIQWGSGGNGREFVAVGKQIWTAGTFLTVPASGLSFHAKGAPGAGARLPNWFVARPHAGFPLPGLEIESASVVSGEWRLVAKSYFLPSAHRVEVNEGLLSSTWQLLNAPVVADLGNNRVDLRFPAAGTRQFVRLSTQ